MNLQHLKYFYDTIRLGSVSQAALENHISQSAVSQGIAKLELSLGKPLLVHRRNRIQLTEEGKSLFPHAQSVLKAIDHLAESLHASEDELTGQTTIATTHSLAQSLLTPLIQRLNAEAPKVRLKLRFGHTGLVKQWLAEGSIDFGIALDNEDLSAFETTLIYQGCFELFRDPKCRLKKPHRAIVTEPRPEVHSLKKAYQEKFKTELITQMEVSSWEMIFTLTKNTPYLGFFPNYLLLHPDRKNLLVPANLQLPHIPYSLFLLRDRLAPLSRSANHFFNLIVANKF